MIRGHGERPTTPPPRAQPASRYGSVHLKEYVPMQNGLMTRVLTGMVTVSEAFDAIGIKVARSETNWFAEIAGDTQTVYIPGCQIRAISHHPHSMRLAADIYKVP